MKTRLPEPTAGGNFLMNENGPTKRVKAGASAQATAERRRLFVEAYLTNGHNGAEAARAAGYGARHAKGAAVRVLALPAVRALLAARARQVAELAEMNTDRWAADLMAVAHFDPGELYDESGTLIPLPKLPEHVRRAIQSIDVVEGGTKLKFWNKNQALETMGRHLGLYNKHNSQLRPDVRVQVILVGDS